MSPFDKIFWVLFVALGATVIASSIYSIFFADVLLGLVIIALGVHKLSQEIMLKKMEKDQYKAQEKIKQILDWLDQNHKYTKTLNAKSDFRFDKLHKKHKEIDESIENRYNELAKNMFKMENLLKELSRVLLTTEKIRSGRGKHL